MKKHPFLFLFALIIFSDLALTVADNTNNAPLFQNGIDQSVTAWGGYNITGTVHYGNPSNPQICFRDDTVTFNGHSSIRVEAPNVYNLYREVNEVWRHVNIGDHIVYRAWIKTMSGYTGHGGIIGFDVYGDTNRLWEVVSHTSGDDSDSFIYPHQWSTYEYVDYGSDWTQITVDIVIPDTVFTQDDKGSSITPQQIEGIILWAGGIWHSRETYPPIWIADTELYINPTDLPEPTNTPIPSITPTPNPTFEPVIVDQQTGLVMLAIVILGFLLISSNKK